MVAEEFETLIAAGAIARPRERGNMRQCLFEQRGILELYPMRSSKPGGVSRRRRGPSSLRT